MRKSLAFSNKSYPGLPGFLSFRAHGYLQFFLEYSLGIAALNQLDTKHTESTLLHLLANFLINVFIYLFNYLFIYLSVSCETVCSELYT